MRASEFLVEYKRDITLRNYREALFKRLAYDDRMPKGHNSLYNHFHKRKENGQSDALNAIINHRLTGHLSEVEAADPTPNKQYVQWLLRSYIKGFFRYWEDVLSTGNEFLIAYHTLKAKRALPGTIPYDINQINRKILFLQSIRHVIDAYRELQPKQETPKGESKEIYNDNQIRVIVPYDQTAACYYGQGTRWCTAATSGRNFFDEYNKDGHLYIIIPKNPNYTGEKYQLSLANDQFMNEEDEEVNELDLIKRWPQLHELLHDDAKEVKSDSTFGVDYNTLANVDEIPYIVEKIFKEFTKPEYVNKWIKIEYLMQRIETSRNNTVPEKEIIKQKEFVKSLIKRLPSLSYMIRNEIKQLLNKYQLSAHFLTHGSGQLSWQIKRLTKEFLHPSKPLPDGSFDLTPNKVTPIQEALADSYAAMVWTEVDALLVDVIAAGVIGNTDAETKQNISKYVGEKQISWDVGY